MKKEEILSNCKKILKAYKTGKLGQTKMPEEASPKFSESEKELKLAFFSLPMALNYQRDSYKLWEAALKTYLDPNTKKAFDIQKISWIEEDQLRTLLLKHKLALQPNKHIKTWKTISKTVFENFGSFTKLLETAEFDFLKLKNIIQAEYKKGFPYLSGPKIFNYWAFILGEYGGINLLNKKQIEIAPDTHVTKSSVRLGIISESESQKITKEELSKRWRNLLASSEINPIDMHPPLWFWSRNGFRGVLK